MPLSKHTVYLTKVFFLSIYNVGDWHMLVKRINQESWDCTVCLPVGKVEGEGGAQLIVIFWEQWESFISEDAQKVGGGGLSLVLFALVSAVWDEALIYQRLCSAFHQPPPPSPNQLELPFFFPSLKKKKTATLFTQNIIKTERLLE